MIHICPFLDIFPWPLISKLVELLDDGKSVGGIEESALGANVANLVLGLSGSDNGLWCHCCGCFLYA